jgi:hypothetical protein
MRRKTRSNGYSSKNWPPMMAPASDPGPGDVKTNLSRGKWVVLTFSYHTRRWDRWCGLRTLGEAERYCDGKFGDAPTQRIVRVTREGKISRIVHRGRTDQLGEDR